MLIEHKNITKEWTITHNFDHFPRVECWVEFGGELVKIIPLRLDKQDEQTIKISFSEPYSGRVKLSCCKAWNAG